MLQLKCPNRTCKPFNVTKDQESSGLAQSCPSCGWTIEPHEFVGRTYAPKTAETAPEPLHTPETEEVDEEEDTD